MSLNLLEMLETSVVPEISKQATSYLGESSSGVKSAIASILPTLVGGLMQSGASNEGAGKLLAMINTGPSIEPGMLTNLSGLFSGGERTGTLLSIGGTLLKNIFGDRADGIYSALSSGNNMKAGSGGSLMAMITPLLFGMLKNHIAANKVDAPGLKQLLQSQQKFVAPALNDKVTQAMGLGTVGAFLGGAATAGASLKAGAPEPIRATGGAPAETTATKTGATVSGHAPASTEVAMNAMNAMNTARSVNYGEAAAPAWKKFLPIGLLAIAGLVAAAYFLKGPNGNANKSVTPGGQDAAKPAMPEAVKPAPDLPKPASDASKPEPAKTEPAKETGKVELPASPATQAGTDMAKTASATGGTPGMKSYAVAGGSKIEVVPNSFGDRLLAALTGPTADPKRTFNLDKVRFPSDSSGLSADAVQQLQEAAVILKAFPTAQIKLDGHADNTGNVVSNKDLSSARADKVKTELVKLGVAASRLSTDSFSASKPIASNNTEAGRLQNRRVELAVIKR